MRPGAPAITVTGPVAAMAWDWPDWSVVVKSTDARHGVGDVHPALPRGGGDVERVGRGRHRVRRPMRSRRRRRRDSRRARSYWWCSCWHGGALSAECGRAPSWRRRPPWVLGRVGVHPGEDQHEDQDKHRPHSGGRATQAPGPVVDGADDPVLVAGHERGRDRIGAGVVELTGSEGLGTGGGGTGGTTGRPASVRRTVGEPETRNALAGNVARSASSPSPPSPLPLARDPEGASASPRACAAAGGSAAPSARRRGSAGAAARPR